MDDGSIKVFTGYRVQHSSVRGPYRGGIRYHPDVNLNEVRAKEVCRLTRRYTTAILPLVGPRRDIPAPDVNTNAQTMAWVADTVSMIEREATMGIVTGKPIDLGGSLGRREATGRGVSIVTAEVLKWK